MFRSLLLLAAVVAFPLLSGPAASGEAAMKHVVALTEMGPRPAGTPKARKAADYIKAQLESYGYQVTEQSFPMTVFDEIGTTVAISGPETREVKASALIYSPSGKVTGELVSVTETHSEAGFAVAKGKIALVSREGVSMRKLSERAAAAGASAVLIYNHKRPTMLVGTLLKPVAIPTLAISRIDGQGLLYAMHKGPVTVAVESRTTIEAGTGMNLVATKTGKGAGTFLIGAHYDSVHVSPGAIDNASGAATVLELARIVATQERPESISFAFFDGEEPYLLGSTAYVAGLSQDLRKGLRGMINLDCVGSSDNGTYYFNGAKELAERALSVARKEGFKASANEDEVDSDAISFDDAGIPVLDFCYTTPDYHLPSDTPENVQPGDLEATVTLVLGTLP